MNVGRSPRQTYKALLFDYDELLSKSDDECCYSLSEREINLLLAQMDYITWKTRYRPTSTEIDRETINKWQGNLARKLMSGCCPDNDELHRYLADGTYQSSSDGGLTWQDDPTGDERYGAPEAPPLPGVDSDNKRCAAADNVRAQFVVMRDGLIDLLTAGTTVLLIVSFLVGLVGGILAISVVGVTWGVILFSLAGALLSLTPESVAAQIDDEALDTFRCLVYCAMGTDGKLPASALPDLLNEIASTFSDFPETFFYSIVASMGATGISNAGTMGAATASDCGLCDCEDTCSDQYQVICGTYLGEFDGYKRYRSEINPDNSLYAVILSTENMATCCQTIDRVVVSGAFGRNQAKPCNSNTFTGWGENACYWFMFADTFTQPNNQFVIDVLFGDC